MKRRTGRKIRKKLAVVLVAGMVIAASAYTYPLAKAVFQREDGVKIQAESIENSTLIIGTHLIHISAMNDELYHIAEKSAERSGQNEIYYKSELAEGKWYNISSASSLSDITETGKAVADEEIEGLLLTHHTKSDGITYNLKKNTAVCIYDIVDPYDLENLEELEPLCNQYDLMKEREKNTDMQTSNGKLVEKFLEQDITTEQTKVYDDQLEALQKYYTSMKKEDYAKENIGVVLKVMGKVDASRRKEALQTISKALNELEENIRDISTVSEKGEVQASEMYDVDEELLEALLESQVKVEESLITYDGNSFDEGTTRMSKMEYDLSKSLVQTCDTSSTESDETVQSLIHLSHIMEGSVIAPVSEAELLNELIKEMEDEYEAVLKKGTGETNDESNSNNIEAKRSELQFYVQSKAERLEPEEAQNFLEECVDKSSEFLEAVPESTTGDTMLASVHQYQSWLQKLVTKSVAGNATSELQQWKEEKEKLEEQKLSALDHNQVEQAKKIQVLIDEKVSKIETAEKEISDEISRLNEQKQQLEAGEGESEGEGSSAEKIADIEKQIALLNAKLPENSTTLNIQESKHNLLQMIENHQIMEGNQEEASIHVEALGALLAAGSQTAGEALKEVYQAMAADTYLSESKVYDTLMNRIEELVADNQAVLNQSLFSETQAFQALKNILGDGIGTLFIQNSDVNDMEENNGEEIEENTDEDTDEGEENIDGDTEEDGEGNADEDLTEQYQEMQTKYKYTYDVSKVDKTDLQAAILALADIAEQTENTALENLALAMVQTVYNQEEDTGIFLYRSDDLEKFAPVSELADYLGYRYVWSDTKKTAVMSKGSTYYSFQAFRRDVDRGKGQREELPCNALFSQQVYIPFTYIEEEFECRVTAVGNTGYGIFADETVLEKAEQIEQQLLK